MRQSRQGRRVRRAANKMIARRRYRERKGTTGLEPVWLVRRGPAGPSEKVKQRAKRAAER